MANNTGVQWDRASFEAVKKAMREYERQVRIQITRYAHHLAIEMENWAKENHPWQNRTHLAEKGLRGYVETKGDNYRIILTHSVDYGLELETKDGGRWGVIWKTLEHFIPIIKADMQQVSDRVTKR